MTTDTSFSGSSQGELE